MRAFVCVCACLCVYVCVCTRDNECVCACTHMCVCVNMCVCVFVCRHACVRARTPARVVSMCIKWGLLITCVPADQHFLFAVWMPSFRLPPLPSSSKPVRCPFPVIVPVVFFCLFVVVVFPFSSSAPSSVSLTSTQTFFFSLSIPSYSPLLIHSLLFHNYSNFPFSPSSSPLPPPPASFPLFFLTPFRSPFYISN